MAFGRYVLAPTPLNIYFSAAVVSWQRKCPEAGGEVLYSPGEEIGRRWTAKSRLCKVIVTESQFADDVALYISSRSALESVTQEFV